MKTVMIVIVSLSLFAFYGCDPAGSYNTSEFTFELADVSCTEAWLRISAGTNEIEYIAIEKDGEEVRSFTSFIGDTVYYSSNLLPNTTYTYNAKFIYGNGLVKNHELNVQTMDTTDHNITWEEFTFGGDYNGSYLNDVVIIDENNIWAVGEIYLNDSLGNHDYHRYIAIHWDGNNWKVTRITTEDNGYKTTASLEGAFAFNSNDIWVTSVVPKHWDGNSWTQYHLFDMGILNSSDGGVSKIWGKSPNDLYMVGRKGCIVHYDGINWNKLENNSDIRLTDIYGTPDGSVIWTCGWDNNHPESVILSIVDQSVNVVWDGKSIFGQYTFGIQSVCSIKTQFWTAGVLVFNQSNLFSDKGHLIYIKGDNGLKLFEPGNFVLSLRGTDYNNIYIAGDTGMLWHFNGFSWHKYEELYNPVFDR